MPSADDLARLRTELANERTLLSWLRTALGLMAAGGVLIRFQPGGSSALVVGVGLVAVGVGCLVGGIVRFRSVRARIATMAL